MYTVNQRERVGRADGPPTVGLYLAVAAFGLVMPAQMAAQGITDNPTYHKDIAPIIQETCQVCHFPGGMGPMSFMSYEEVRPWAPLIKHETSIRHMPPWHIDATLGVREFKNDVSLTNDQIMTIAKWVDAGAPEGDIRDAPLASRLEAPEPGAWQAAAEIGRPPDMVIRSTPFTMPAFVQDQWWDADVPFPGVSEERWLMAAEFKPAAGDGLKVVHHGHAVLEMEGGEGAGIARYGVGKAWEIFPDGVGMRIPSGPGTVSWNIHYASIDRDVVDDVVEVGLWFYPEGERPRIETQGEQLFRVDNPGHMRGQDILIAPHGHQVLQAFHTLESAAIIHSVRAHMHTRGKMMTVEALYPDGRRELLSEINNFDHNWQTAFLYEDHARPLLPAGTVLFMTSVFDNTAANRINPDPDQWVIFGRRAPDEMSHFWIGISYVPNEELERLISERQEESGVEGMAQVSGR